METHGWRYCFRWTYVHTHEEACDPYFPGKITPPTGAPALGDTPAPGKFSLFFDRRRCILKIIRIENKVGDQRSPSPGKGARRLYRDIGPDPGGHGSGFDNFGGVSVAGDLHCHTKISDGSMGIDELIAFAKRRGLSAISITDHDTTASATRAVVIGYVSRSTSFTEWSCPPGTRPGTGRRICSVISAIFPIGWRPVPPYRREPQKASMTMIRKVMRYYPIPLEMIVKCATGSTNIFKQHHARPDGRRLRGHHLRRAV